MRHKKGGNYDVGGSDTWVILRRFSRIDRNDAVSEGSVECSNTTDSQTKMSSESSRSVGLFGVQESRGTLP